MTLAIAAGADRGWKKAENQDRYIVRECEGGSFFLAVADGMGGMPEGKLAATMAVAVLGDNADTSTGKPDGLLDLSYIANEKILRHAREKPRAKGMGTTLTAATVRGDAVEWVHTGDSRLCLLHDGLLRRLSADHRFFSRMLERGEITPREAAGHRCGHMLEKCLAARALSRTKGACGWGRRLPAAVYGWSVRGNDGETHGACSFPRRSRFSKNVAASEGGP